MLIADNIKNRSRFSGHQKKTHNNKHDIAGNIQKQGKKLNSLLNAIEFIHDFLIKTAEIDSQATRKTYRIEYAQELEQKSNFKFN